MQRRAGFRDLQTLQALRGSVSTVNMCLSNVKKARSAGCPLGDSKIREILIRSSFEHTCGAVTEYIVTIMV
jgi:hypothetical protein